MVKIFTRSLVLLASQNTEVWGLLSGQGTAAQAPNLALLPFPGNRITLFVYIYRRGNEKTWSI